MKIQLLVHDLQNVYRFIRDKEYHDAMKLLEDIIVDVSFLPDEDKVTIELARITAENKRNRLDLARAIAWIDENVSFSEADKFAGTTLFDTWQEVQSTLKDRM